MRNGSRLVGDDVNKDNQTDEFLLDDAAKPSKFTTLYTSTSTNVTADSGTIQQQHTLSEVTESVHLAQRSCDQDRRREVGSSSSSNSDTEQFSEEANHGENPAIVKRIHQLERQVFELQQVLREYYIDMDYLDNRRNMRRRARHHTSYYDRQSNSIEGGWIFDDSDDESIHKDSKH